MRKVGLALSFLMWKFKIYPQNSQRKFFKIYPSGHACEIYGQNRVKTVERWRFIIASVATITHISIAGDMKGNLTNDDENLSNNADRESD